MIRRIPVIMFLSIFLLAAGACSEPAKTLFDRAGLDAVKGDWESASSHYSRLIENYPQSRFAPNAILKLADIHGFVDKDFDRALEEYDLLLCSYPQSDLVPHALMSKAEIIKERKQDLCRSLETAERIYQQYPSFEDKDYLLIFMARCLESMESFTRERAILRELLLTFPQSAYGEEGHYMYGMACLADGLVDEALLVFKSYLGQYPEGRFASKAEIGYSEALMEKRGKNEAASYLAAAAERYEKDERDIIEERIHILKNKVPLPRLKIPGRKLGGRH